MAGLGWVADPEAQCANGTDGVPARGMSRSRRESVELAGDAAALFHGAEGGEAFDALDAALLDVLDFVDLVADEFEEAGHDLAQGGVQRGQGDGGDVGFEPVRWSGSLIDISRAGRAVSTAISVT